MTLDTRVIIHEPISVRRVFDHCRKLIGADDDGYWYEHRTMPADYDNAAFFNPSYRGRIDQGKPALLWVYYGPDGPLRRGEYGPEPETPPGFIEVSFDTAYGYRHNGASCNDLHAWLVRELGRWLDEQGTSWSWQNEYTGEWFRSYDGLDAFGDANRGAAA